MRNPFKTYAIKCGHEVPLKGVIEVSDKILPARRKNFQKTNYCYKCESKRSILCASCGEIIIPGNSVAAARFAKTEKNNFLQYAYCKNELEHDFLVCVGFDACAGGEFMIGHWDGEIVIPINFS